APNSQDHLRVLGVLFDLRTQAIDVRIDRSVVAFVRVIPDLLEQVLAREHAARIRREQTQQIKLLRRQLNLPVANRYFALGRIYPQPAAHDRSFVSHSIRRWPISCTPEYGLDAGF